MEEHVDEFGVDVAYYTEIEFDFLDDQIGEVDAAFQSFIDFVEDHHTAFTEKMKKICLRVVKELAATSYGTSKKEIELIEKLKKTLKKI